MPPHNPLLSLNDLCIDWVLGWLFRSLKFYGDPKERLEQRDYVISNLTPNLRQILVSRVFQQHMYKWNLSNKCLMLDLLGDISTQCIDFTKTGYAYADEIWHFYRTLVSGKIINLKKLGIVYKLRTESDKKQLLNINNTFYRVFSQMKNLRWASLNGVADKVLLKDMGTNCPHLEYLSVAESPEVNDEAIASLIIRDTSTEGQKSVQLGRQNIPTNPCANSLKTVCVSETNVSLVSVAILIHFVPKLESLGGDVHAGSVTNVMKDLHIQDGHKAFKLHAMWDARILPDQAALLNKLCPHLTKLSTDASSLDSIQNLTSISSLTLSLYYQNFKNEIYDYLLENGENLKELILVDHINCYLDLPMLAELAPNLEVLEASLDIDEDDEMTKWSCLKTARVTVESSRVLRALLTNIPEIKELDITFVREPYQETCECINDDLITNIVVAGSLKKLQKLKISECGIGLQGIESLILHCPNLTYIAPLAFWYGVTNLNSLVQRVKKNNWLLKIVMRTDWEDGSELRSASKVES